MTPSAAPSSAQPPRWAAGLLLGTLAALLAALPAALRSPAPLVTWLLLAGSAALLTAPLGALLRASALPPRALLPALTAAALAGAPLALLGGLLKTATHHRPLGATTFALLGLGLGLGLVVLTARLRGAPRLLGALTLLGAAALAWRLLPALGLDAALRQGMLDGALLLLAVAIAWRLPLPAPLRAPWVRLVGPLGLLLGLGLAVALGVDAQRRRAADSAGAVLLWPAQALLPLTPPSGG